MHAHACVVRARNTNLRFWNCAKGHRVSVSGNGIMRRNGNLSSVVNVFT